MKLNVGDILYNSSKNWWGTMRRVEMIGDRVTRYRFAILDGVHQGQVSNVRESTIERMLSTGTWTVYHPSFLKLPKGL